MDIRRSARIKEMGAHAERATKVNANAPVETKATRTTPKPEVKAIRAQDGKSTKRHKKDTNPPTAEPRVKPLRGMRGKLRQLTEFPLDVLYEIFGHLNPLDILHLARSTKALRAILMNRSAVSVWKRARGNVKGLPPCPGNLTEPQYANLAFDAHCHFCLVPNIQTIVWTARIRCCQKCSIKRFLDAEALMIRRTTNKLPPSCHQYLPYMTEIISGKMKKTYSVADAERWNKEYVNIAVDKDAEKEWITEKMRITHIARADAARCRVWHKNRLEDHSHDVRNARIARVDAIVRKLSELGWGEDLSVCGSHEFLHHPSVRQSKALTDRTWNNIKPTLIEFMEGKRAARLEKIMAIRRKSRYRLLCSVHRTYVASCPIDAIIPSAAELSQFKPFRAVTRDRPSSESEGDEIFAEALKSLPELIVIWRKEKERELVAIMKKALGRASMESLRLATTFFRFRQTVTPIAYPHILHDGVACDRDYGVSGELGEMLNIMPHGMWNMSRSLVYSEAAADIARSIVVACGLDPTTATAEDVNAMRPIIECRCDSVYRLVMTWTQSVNHLVDRPYLTHKWKLLVGEEERRVARERMLEEYRYWMESRTQCTRCRYVAEYRGVWEHFRTVHGDDFTDEELALTDGPLPNTRIPS